MPLVMEFMDLTKNHVSLRSGRIKAFSDNAIKKLSSWSFTKIAMGILKSIAF